MLWYFIIFISACFLLAWLSSRLVNSLVQVAKYLRWREFIIAFFVMAFAASLPNLFVDLNAALHHLPELAFGDIIGGNLVDLTLVLAIAVFFSKKGLSSKSDVVQKSASVTAIAAVLPLLLIVDNKLDRIDGVILMLAFVFYSLWLFSKKERFKKVYKNHTAPATIEFKSFFGHIVKIIIFLILLFFASGMVVGSAQFFSYNLGISIGLVGILIVGLGNCFPELYFSVISAREEENWLVLGDLMGSVIIASTLVLGIIAFVSPFEVKNFSPFLIARIFLIVVATVSLVFIKSGKKVTKREAAILLFVYIAFLLAEVFIKF